MKNALLIAVVLLLVSGCAVEVGRKDGTLALEDQTRETLESAFPLETTQKRDVLFKLGAPQKTEHLAGTEIWEYEYSRPAAAAFIFVASRVGEKKRAVFFFDESGGRLKKIEFSESSR